MINKMILSMLCITFLVHGGVAQAQYGSSTCATIEEEYQSLLAQYNELTAEIDACTAAARPQQSDLGFFDIIIIPLKVITLSTGVATGGVVLCQVGDLERKRVEISYKIEDLFASIGNYGCR